MTKTLFHILVALDLVGAIFCSAVGKHDQAIVALLSAILLKLFSIGEELRA
jgi:hypothetical protein